MTLRCEVSEVAPAYVLARGCEVLPLAAVTARVDEAVARAKAAAPRDEVKKAVRDMLRFGKYKPTGRGKPASEYLLQAAIEGGFPRVSALVDLANIASLDALLPISLIDLERATSDDFVVRRGRADESYVFNASGQSIALHDLLLTAKNPGDVPCANAVKDSLATKLAPEARDVLAVIYAPRGLGALAEHTARAFADALRASVAPAQLNVATL